MPKVKKVDEVAVLAEQMLDLLGTRRTLGSEAYPPTLAQLAEACGVPPDAARVLKAVAKKAFTDKATAKASGKISLESKVYFQEDVPDPVVELAGRMLRVLDSQRNLGGDAYPPTLGRLAELCGLRASNPLVPKAGGHESMAAEVSFANAGKPATDSPVILNRHIEDEAKAWNSALLAFAFGKAYKPKATLAFTPKQLASKLQTPLRRPFEDALKARVGRKDLPASYGWLANKEPLIFRLDDIQPGPPSRPQAIAAVETPPPVAPAPAEAPPPVAPAPAPGRDFAEAFRQAFDRLDRLNRRSNNVKLVDLRRELADFPRERFDLGLRQLRATREFSLERHEGLLRPLTPEEREAGIAESGSLLVYVSRSESI